MLRQENRKNEMVTNPLETRVLPVSLGSDVSHEPERKSATIDCRVSLRPEWKASVDAKQAATAIIGTVAALSILGCYLVYTGRFPTIPPVLYLAAVGFIWTSFLFWTIRFGRRIVNGRLILQLIALSAFLVANGLPDGTVVKPWLMNAWMVWVFVDIGAKLFTVCRRPPEPRDETEGSSAT